VHPVREDGPRSATQVGFTCEIVCCAAQCFLGQIIDEPHPARRQEVQLRRHALDEEWRGVGAPVFLGNIVRDQLAREVELPSPIQGV
jgi:hypothetical protein